MTTIDYYDNNSDAFFAATVHADMAETRTRFLQHVPAGGHILDAGCGSGRDTAAFINAGYRVTAFDASEEMVRRAIEHSRVPVIQMTFDDVSWREEFDGIWACASLLHVPKVELGMAMAKLAKAIRPQGVLYGSFKYGAGEVVREGRHFTNMDEVALTHVMGSIPILHPVEIWLSIDVRPERSDRWLNFIYRKIQ